MDRKFEDYGGQGYGYSKETGDFMVKTEVIKKFTNLSEAKQLRKRNIIELSRKRLDPRYGFALPVKRLIQKNVYLCP